MRLLEQISFIKGIAPFDKLDNESLNRVVENLDIVYFKKDETILSNAIVPEFLYFIIKGAVQERDDNEVVSLITEHGYFDAKSLIENHVKHDFVTVIETICYELPRDIFMEILHQDSSFEQYFFQSISQRLSQADEDEKSKELTNFMVSRVSEAYLQEPLIVDGSLSIYEAVEKMKEVKASSLLVKSDNRIGIVTDADFKDKFVLGRLSCDDKIEKLVTFNLIDINENEFLFNAQLKMTKKGIKRLVVKDDDGNITGILDQISLMSFFASHTYAISNEIEKAEDLEDLKLASQKMIRVIKALYAKGVKVRYISKLISQLNEKIFEKTFLFLAPEELFENSSLIVMGSEGREEQILKTDQDNALILSDDCDIDSDKLMSFTNKFTQTLLEFGYPKCDGFIMVSNPKWVMSESKFKEKLSEWIDKKDGDSFMNMAIVYDAISVAGDKRLLENLKEYMLKNIDVSSALFSSFARASISFETPLGLFSDFSVEKNGLLDIKKGGIFAIVHGIRSLSFEKGLLETNTVVRIKKLNDLGVIDRRLSEDLIESFTFFLSLRLDSNLKHIDCAEETSNFINPKSLSKSQKDLLKDALKTVDKFKKFLTYHYKLNLLG